MPTTPRQYGCLRESCFEARATPPTPTPAPAPRRHRGGCARREGHGSCCQCGARPRAAAAAQLRDPHPRVCASTHGGRGGGRRGSARLDRQAAEMRNCMGTSAGARPTGGGRGITPHPPPPPSWAACRQEAPPAVERAVAPAVAAPGPLSTHTAPHHHCTRSIRHTVQTAPQRHTERAPPVKQQPIHPSPPQHPCAENAA